MSVSKTRIRLAVLDLQQIVLQMYFLNSLVMSGIR